MNDFINAGEVHPHDPLILLVFVYTLLLEHNGDNDGISTAQVREVVGKDKGAAMAPEPGADEDSPLNGLKDALPQMIDKSGTGGALLENHADLLKLVRKFFQDGTLNQHHSVCRQNGPVILL